VSTTGFWLFVAVPPERHADVARLLEGIHSRELSLEENRVHEQWRLNQSVPIADRGLFARPFVAAIQGDADLIDVLRPSENPYLGSIGTDRTVPTAVLWYAIGPDKAALVPGRFGNMLLQNAEIPDALERISSALAVAPSEFAERVGFMLEHTNNDHEETIRELRTKLIDALSQAKGLGVGFMTWTIVV
jgi:hypothetical protein